MYSIQKTGPMTYLELDQVVFQDADVILRCPIVQLWVHVPKARRLQIFVGGQVLNNMCQGVGWLWSTEVNSHANDDHIKCSYSMLFTPSCGWPQTTHWKQIAEVATCWIEFTKLTTAQFGPHLQASGDMWLCGVVMICPQNILSSTSSYALKDVGFKDGVTFFKK